MSIEKIYPEDLEVFTLETNPSYTYSSSSSGISGSVYVYASRPIGDKDLENLSESDGSIFQSTRITDLIESAKYSARMFEDNSGAMGSYFDFANNLESSARKQTKKEIIRTVPGPVLSKSFSKKKIMQNVLYPEYRTKRPGIGYGFVNYNSLNFFTSSTVNSDSVLLYPFPGGTDDGTSGYLTGSYIPNNAFTFDFWINPRYTTDLTGSAANFKAGTILHLSSCYAISLVTGSSKDPNGKPDRYRILFQVSSSATRKPSEINLSSLPDMCFVSADNSLEFNKWSHVSIRWNGPEYNLGTGSIFINLTQSSTFTIPSASIIPTTFLPGASNPEVLCVGNFYEGTNSGTNSMRRFFGNTTTTEEGLINLINLNVSTPDSFTFNHPLNAEIHDLKIYNKFLSLSDIESLNVSGPEKNQANLLFYLPPFYTVESPTRTILTSPFYTDSSKTTTQPFSTALAFNLDSHYMNLENYTREMVNGVYPKLLNLTMSVATAPSPMLATIDDILYATQSVRKRQLTILPNDNGNFIPKFQSWFTTLSQSSFINEFGTLDYSFVSLYNMISTSSIYTSFGPQAIDEVSILGALVGADPTRNTTFTTAPGIIPAVLQYTRDNSSNHIVMFDISNLFYGNRINPKSVVLTDASMSGSGGKMSITLIDDGMGNLYRADTLGVKASWNSVGTIFYDEGLIAILNPSLYFFGKDQFEISFEGEQTTHTLKIGCTARALMETSSSNVSYLPVSASDYANDLDKKFVYITEVLIHDDNLNVIGKTKLAQPYQKRTGDRTKFYWRMDF